MVFSLGCLLDLTVCYVALIGQNELVHKMYFENCDVPNEEFQLDFWVPIGNDRSQELYRL